MDNQFSIKKLLFGIAFALIALLIFVFQSFTDKQTKIIFCDVGQGDATYIRVKNQADLLVDAGPNNRILSCLGKYMPFFDRKIELVIISHPQTDHFGGLLEIIKRYKIEKIITSPIDNSNTSFTKLKKYIENKGIDTLFFMAGDKVLINNDQLSFYWPSESFLTRTLIYDRPRYLDSQVLGASSLDLNYFSLIFMFEEGSFRILFTGDAPFSVLNRLLKQDDLKSTILKIPHHGSKNGLTKTFLNLANPQVAVISVGKNNPHGHPSKDILEMLQASQIKIKRTDEEGDIVFKLR